MSKEEDKVEEKVEKKQDKVEFDPRRRGNASLKDIHKQQLEKLMEEPDKLVEIPDKSKDWKPPEPPEIMRFYMGSSAGAGSEVFHVYRHLRRYEMTRQQWIDETAKAEDKDTAFMMRLAGKRFEAEEKTAKKRAKRLKKKGKQKMAKNVKENNPKDEEETEIEPTDIVKEDITEEDIEENPFIIGGR